MNAPVLERAGSLLAIVFGARVWAKWRFARREQAALTTPLVNPVVLETVFAPRAQDSDDADLLAEMRDTFLHLNRRAYAEEFWHLHAQLVSLYETLGDTPRATMRRALLRLITANDRWLQLVGAKTASELGVQEAIPPLTSALNSCEADDSRYRQELEQALTALTGAGKQKLM